MTKQYPVVLLHGMFGFGQQQTTNNVLPYFGIWNTDIRRMFNDMGVPCVAPSMGPFTSAWNRACEVYARDAPDVERVGADLHHDAGAAALVHLREQLVQLRRLRRGVF